MEKHTEMSWKNENVVSQLHNSVDTVTTAVGQAQTNPTDQLIEHAKSLVDRADHAVLNAQQNSENLEPIQRIQEQLNKEKQRLQQLYSQSDLQS